jgi:hypothetical protein
VDGITGEEDQKRGEKISDEARAAIDENCLAWVRKVTGNPAATVLPLAQERVYEISDLVWSLAYRAGREDAARDLRKIAVSSDKGNILRDLLDFAADVTEGKYTAAQVSLAGKVAAGDRTDDLDGDGVQPTEEQPDE